MQPVKPSKVHSAARQSIYDEISERKEIKSGQPPALWSAVVSKQRPGPSTRPQNGQGIPGYQPEGFSTDRHKAKFQFQFQFQI